MAILTRQDNKNKLDLTINQIKESANTAGANNLHFIGLGGFSAFTDENTPPIETIDDESSHNKIHRELILGQMINSGDVTRVVRRYNWASGTKYAQYADDNASAFSNNNGFYVHTDEGNVYKCLDNAYGSPSTVQPTGTSNTPFYTGDDNTPGGNKGYKWKYMYNVSAANLASFGTTDYIPIEEDSTVVESAISGTLERIELTSNGTQYTAYANGTIGNVTNTTNFAINVTIPSTLAVNDSFVNNAIHFTSGALEGSVGIIAGYNATTKTITLSNNALNMSNASHNGLSFRILPQVIIAGTGSGAKAVAVVNASSNTINYVEVLSTGNSYTQATVSIVSNTSFVGSNATAKAILSPKGGHGSDQYAELGAEHYEIYKEFDGTASGSLQVGFKYRTVSLLKNILMPGTTTKFSNQVFTAAANFGVTKLDPGLTDSFTVGDHIQWSSGNGSVIFANTTYVSIANTLGTITTGDTLSTANVSLSGKYAINTTVSVANSGDIEPFSGDVMYYQNATAVTRASDQKESIRIIVKV